MKKTEKFEPQDSDQRPRKGNQAVVDHAETEYRQNTAKTGKPALKRKFSEQPPTKRNSKT